MDKGVHINDTVDGMMVLLVLLDEFEAILLDDDDADELRTVPRVPSLVLLRKLTRKLKVDQVHLATPMTGFSQVETLAVAFYSLYTNL